VPIQRPEYVIVGHLVASILSFLSARWAEEKLRQSGSGPSSSSSSNWNRKDQRLRIPLNGKIIFRSGKSSQTTTLEIAEIFLMNIFVVNIPLSILSINQALTLKFRRKQEIGIITYMGRMHCIPYRALSHLSVEENTVQYCVKGTQTRDILIFFIIFNIKSVFFFVYAEGF
jgi:hypothetical protein